MAVNWWASLNSASAFVCRLSQGWYDFIMFSQKQVSSLSSSTTPSLAIYSLSDLARSAARKLAATEDPDFVNWKRTFLPVGESGIASQNVHTSKAKDLNRSLIPPYKCFPSSTSFCITYTYISKSSDFKNRRQSVPSDFVLRTSDFGKWLRRP